MHENKKSSAELYALREEFFRPSRLLGYDHNTLAAHLLERGAYAIAEAELRRANWLNPYEVVFLANLAWCLFKQKRYDEALAYADEVTARGPSNPQILDLVKRIRDEIPTRLMPDRERNVDDSKS